MHRSKTCIDVLGNSQSKGIWQNYRSAKSHPKPSWFAPLREGKGDFLQGDLPNLVLCQSCIHQNMRWVFGNFSSKNDWPKFSICQLLSIGTLGNSRSRSTRQKHSSAKTHLVSKLHISKPALRYVGIRDPNTFGGDLDLPTLISYQDTWIKTCVETSGNSRSKILGRNTELPNPISYQSCISRNMHWRTWKLSIPIRLAEISICQLLSCIKIHK